MEENKKMNKYQKALEDIKRYKANSHRLGDCKPLREQLTTLQELVDLQPTGEEKPPVRAKKTLKTITKDMKDLYKVVTETIDRLDEKDWIDDGDCLRSCAGALRNTADIYLAILNETTKKLLQEEIDRRMNDSEIIPTAGKA